MSSWQTIKMLQSINMVEVSKPCHWTNCKSSGKWVDPVSTQTSHLLTATVLLSSLTTVIQNYLEINEISYGCKEWLENFIWCQLPQEEARERCGDCESAWVKTEGSSKATLRVSEQDSYVCELSIEPEIPQLQTKADVKGQLQTLSWGSNTEHLLFNKWIAEVQIPDMVLLQSSDN